MIKTLLELFADLAGRCSLPLRRLCPAAGIARSSLMRWRRRAGSGGQPLLQRPGPRKFAVADISAIRQDIWQLDHGVHRSRGTTALYAKYAGAVSRRELDEMVETARAEANREQRSSLRRITWHAAGVAWSMDDTEYPHADADVCKPQIHHVKDLGAKYTFPPFCGPLAEGEEVAGNLQYLFAQYGAPLFLKRDQGGNLNHSAVDEVMAEYAVLPLNSPVCYQPYNGAIEEAQGELKQELRNQAAVVTWKNGPELDPYARAAAHELNHRPKPCLRGKTPCRVFFDHRIKFSKPERKAIYGWIIERSDRILSGEVALSRHAAWRIAAEQWLVKHDLIAVSINKQVSPNFLKNWYH